MPHPNLMRATMVDFFRFTLSQVSDYEEELSALGNIIT